MTKKRRLSEKVPGLPQELHSNSGRRCFVSIVIELNIVDRLISAPPQSRRQRPRSGEKQCHTKKGCGNSLPALKTKAKNQRYYRHDNQGCSSGGYHENIRN